MCDIVCEPFVSELCSLNLAPLPSSFEQHTGNHLPLSSYVTDLHWSFAYTLFMTGKDSCRMDKGDDLSWGALACHFLPPILAVAYSTWLIFFLWVTLQGWNHTAQCFSVLPCLLSSLPAFLRTEVCLRLTASGRWSLCPPAHSQYEQQSNSTSSSREFGVFFCIAEVRKPINFETNVCKYIY